MNILKCKDRIWRMLVFMVSETIIDLDFYPTPQELQNILPIQTKYFSKILQFLDETVKITYDDEQIVWTGISNRKLWDLVKNSVKVKVDKRSREAKEQPEILKKLIQKEP